ncbi:MAG: bifunctional hydroxymethylpyrimidine kinase/phosphomethylpyrimidine kinase [Deltaproteobacteria bacterium RIFCSPLOWO2_02_FULL_53_8]|nr:MAG: bifunctional hydroxymethylpyrimidine kinase/phosphomethylpyrimidine kinase [Deltaproteobacteria bacterium RIFCSPLOWO2_02_FULL_53_8]
MKTALTIAGSDPTTGAGAQSDLHTFAAFGVYGLSAITSLTAQTRSSVKAAMHTPPAFVTKQITVLLSEFEINAAKIGMTGTAANVVAIGRILKKQPIAYVVLDPVMRSTSGYPLIDDAGEKALRKLLPLVTLVTPNLAEASVFTGLKVRDVHEMELAATIIHGQGAQYVLIKGGHLKDAAVDILYDGSEYHYFEAPRLKRQKEELHGTGCLLSAGITAGLAKGAAIQKAVGDAKAYLGKVLEERKRR